MLGEGQEGGIIFLLLVIYHSEAFVRMTKNVRGFIVTNSHLSSCINVRRDVGDTNRDAGGNQIANRHVCVCVCVCVCSFLTSSFKFLHATQHLLFGCLAPVSRYTICSLLLSSHL